MFGCLEGTKVIGGFKGVGFWVFWMFRVVPTIGLLKLSLNFKLRLLFSNHSVNNNVDIQIKPSWWHPISTFMFFQILGPLKC
jgi:hypothetical protein